MEKKVYASTKNVTQELIGWWFLWGIVFGLLYEILYNLISSVVELIILRALIAVFMQGFFVYIIWKYSIKSTFKKRTMPMEFVPKVMKNLLIFTIIICVINSVYQIASVNSIFDKEIYASSQFSYAEKLMTHLYSEDQMAEYNKQKEEAIKQSKKRIYMYLVIIEIGLTAVYVGVLPLEKREILKYVS